MIKTIKSQLSSNFPQTFLKIIFDLSLQPIVVENPLMYHLMC